MKSVDIKSVQTVAKGSKCEKNSFHICGTYGEGFFFFVMGGKDFGESFSVQFLPRNCGCPVENVFYIKYFKIFLGMLNALVKLPSFWLGSWIYSILVVNAILTLKYRVAY